MQVKDASCSRPRLRGGGTSRGGEKQKRTGSGVEQVLLDLPPSLVRLLLLSVPSLLLLRLVPLVLLPDEDLAVEGARGENGAEGGVRPGEGVDGSVVAEWEEGESAKGSQRGGKVRVVERTR
jgi:hypothetical protein